MRRQRKNPEHDPFQCLRTYIPKGTKVLLDEVSAKTGLPISRLIAFAIDNELDAATPFNYPCLMPSTTYLEFAYAHEARLIVKFLLQFPSGVGRDQIMLFRRDIGIPNRETLMLAYRELIEVGVIEEVDPSARSKWEYPEGYKFSRLKAQRREPGGNRTKRMDIAKIRKNMEKHQAEFDEKHQHLKETYFKPEEPS